MQSIHMRLDIGPNPFQCNLNIWDQLAPTIAPQNLVFRLLGRKGRILIPSFDLPYDLVSLSQIATIRVYLLVTHPWLFSAQGVPSFNFGNSFVSHVQRLDENLTAVELSGNLSGRIPAPNFYTTINSLSNQFLFTLNDCAILEPVFWTWYFLSFSHSFARLQIPKSCLRTISHTCKSSWTIFQLLFLLLRNFPYRTS